MNTSPLLRSSFDLSRVDMETVEQMAFLMGVDLDILRTEMYRRQRESQVAWEVKKDPNWETTKAFHRYEEVFSYQGRQIFYNDWHDVYAVFGIRGGMKDVTTLDDAIRLVYRG